MSKAYRTGPPWRARLTPVLDKVHLELAPGEVLGMVGANGAGKTTLLKIVASLTLPDEGNVEVAGVPVHRGTRARRSIGFASGDSIMLFPRLTGLQNLHFFSRLHGLSQVEASSRIDELVAALDLAGDLARSVDRCSTGTRVRFGLARALLHRPRLLLLDEPTRSLDPGHLRAVHELVRGLATQGAAVVVVTHDRQELELVATRLAELHDGHLSVSSTAGARRTAS